METIISRFHVNFWGCIHPSKTILYVLHPFIPSTNLTVSLHLKMDGWKMILSFWDGLCSDAKCEFQGGYMGVSKNRGTPKWMVFFMENPIKMDDLGYPYF